MPFYLLSVPVDLPAQHEALIEAIRSQVGKPAVVVIDTLNRAMIGDENRSDDMAKFIRAADAVKNAFDYAVIIVHHCGIAGSRPRGHTSLSGADDAQIAIERDSSGVVTATIEHIKDGSDGAVIKSRLERVEIGTDECGDPITSCIVLSADGETAGCPREPKATGQAKIAVDLLRRAIEDAGEPVTSNHVPPKTGTVHLELWRRYYYQGTADDDIERDTQKTRFRRARDTLQAAKMIGIWE
jgi:hypothetical protein